MRESIVLLPGPGTGFDVVDAAHILVPCCFLGLLMSVSYIPNLPREKGKAYHLHELGVLHHHGVNNAQKTFIRWKDTDAPSQSIALHETLAHMLAQNFDNATSLGVGEFIPLEVPTCV